MITLTGKKVSEGIAIGKLSFYKRDTKENRRIYVKDVEKEVMRFQKARQKAILELKILYDTAAKEVKKPMPLSLRCSRQSWKTGIL